ncbi:LacI family DNA-binding transcriptional regulator [Nocardioides sp. TRM66260-LWL]|uniref:LacI family DNA-binding transcriptional regulator n=1 Tax=Nocardioides sp. TRM66260-LWL TaxID=2874478 RepID=UPI001CC7C884|nr:LacI family DNA-binding transcriptional regulator [Nocardioides sp. TRM66260-LWL]MBZ5735280.1 LacI family DNA-binding transcriptional regulator [Nocardioides sp. TRM66260-LWL]
MPDDASSQDHPDQTAGSSGSPAQSRLSRDPDRSLPAGRPATLKDVAALAGVSIKTASRVVNGERVNPAMEERVRSAVGILAYRANPLARQLKRGGVAPRLVVLCVPTLATPGLADLHAGLAEGLGCADQCGPAVPDDGCVLVAPQGSIERLVREAGVALAGVVDLATGADTAATEGHLPYVRLVVDDDVAEVRARAHEQGIDEVIVADAAGLADLGALLDARAADAAPVAVLVQGPAPALPPQEPRVGLWVCHDELPRSGWHTLRPDAVDAGRRAGLRLREAAQRMEGVHEEPVRLLWAAPSA